MSCYFCNTEVDSAQHQLETEYCTEVKGARGYLSDRGGHGGHLAEKFLKKYCS